MSVQDQLNRSMPAAKHAMLGDVLADLIAQHNALLARASSALLTSGGLAIKAGSSTLVKAANAFVANVGGVLVYKAAATDMAALVGSVADTKAAAFCFYVDAAGTLTSAKMADAASVAAAIAAISAAPDDKTMIGFAVVSNATGAPFVGGTTALDAASVTVVYVNTIGSTPVGADSANSEVEGLETRAQ